MAQTALTLVNRLLRRSRMDDVSAFTSPEALLALELVNTSIRELLAERDYPWNIRHDGHLTINGPFSSGTLSLIQNSATGTIASSNSITSITGDFVSRLVPFGASDYEKQTIKIVSATVVLTSMSLTLAAAWPGSNTGALTGSNWRIDISEYLLPDAVAKVLSVRHEQTPVTLHQVEPTTAFEEFQPRPADVQNDFPYMVGVGGTAVATFNTATYDATTAPRRLRFMVWPVPDSTYLLTYSYKERIAELSATTDTLWTPDEFCDDVIERADAKVYANAWGNDPDLASLKLRMSVGSTTQKYANARVDPRRRHVLTAHDSGPRRSGDPTKYRDVGSL